MPQVGAGKRLGRLAAGRVQKKKKGRPAKAPTGAEFKAFIRDVLRTWHKKEREAGRLVADPILSWDNASPHGKVREGEWAGLGIDAHGTHMLVPPYSPDMHSVIELSHAEVMRGVQEFIRHRKGPKNRRGLQPYVDNLFEEFYTRITPEWVQKATHRLFIYVLPAILDAKGDYPPKQLR